MAKSGDKDTFTPVGQFQGDLLPLRYGLRSLRVACCPCKWARPLNEGRGLPTVQAYPTETDEVELVLHRGAACVSRPACGEFRSSSPRQATSSREKDARACRAPFF